MQIAEITYDLYMRKFDTLALIGFILILGLGMEAEAKKIDLDDIQIKGELHSDNRLRFYQRNRAKLQNRVRIPSDFRNKIKSGYPKLKEHKDLDSLMTEK